MLKAPGIYLIANLESGGVYVGSAINLSNRFAEHRKRLRRGDHENPRLQYAWKKYGESAFDFRIVGACPRESLLAMEQLALDRALEAYGRDRIYNVCLTAWSRIGMRHRPESIRRMSEAKRGKTPTAEARAKMSASHRGKSRSLEAIEKTRLAHRGQKRSPEARAKMSAASKNRDRSTWAKTPEHRAKIAAAMRGNTNRRTNGESR